MISVYEAKPGFQRLLRPVCLGLLSLGITPNAVTLAAIALSVGAGATIYLAGGSRFALLALPGVLFVRMALNALDGVMARTAHAESGAGAVLNELGDAVSDVALYLPLAFVPGFPTAAIIAVVILGLLSEIAGLAGAATTGVRRYDGPMGKSDRALVIGALSFAAGVGTPVGVWVDIAFVVVGLLLVATIATRSLAAAKEGAKC